MPEGLCKNSVADIARFVARGNSQSPANCRILLREIEHLRAAAREQQHRADQFLAASLKKQSPTIDSDTRYRIIRAIARSEEHTSELQSLMRISYAVFCLKNKKQTT